MHLPINRFAYIISFPEGGHHGKGGKGKGPDRRPVSGNNGNSDVLVKENVRLLSIDTLTKTFLRVTPARRVAASARDQAVVSVAVAEVAMDMAMVAVASVVAT